MALKLNCLIKDTTLKSDIQDYIKDLVAIRIADNKNAKIESVYEEVRKDGIEIDAESFAHLYNEAYNNVVDDKISNSQEIIDFAELGTKGIMRRIGNSAKGKTPTTKVNQIGRLSPVDSALSKVLQLFDSNN